jgi:hypothetical protein
MPPRVRVRPPRVPLRVRQAAIVTDQSDEDQDRIANEIAALSRQVTGIEREIKRLHEISLARNSGWLRVAVKSLETDPHAQYTVHRWGMYYWLLNFPAVIVLYVFEPRLWLSIGILITLLYSVYANFATDYGAMSAAMAAYGDEPPPPIPGTQFEPVPGEPSEAAVRSWRHRQQVRRNEAHRARRNNPDDD